MRKLIVTEFLSLDGVFQAPGPDGSGYKYEGWTFPFNSQEFIDFKLSELMASDCQLLGRVTYEGFSKAWPGQKDPMGFADKFNNMPKYVVSRTLKHTTWNNSHIINDHIVEEIKKLKAEKHPQTQEKNNEGNILVSGSGVLVRFLMKNNLVDQFNFLVYPVVLGEGKKLFQGAQKEELKLVESKIFDTGVVKLIYNMK